MKLRTTLSAFALAFGAGTVSAQEPVIDFAHIFQSGQELATATQELAQLQQMLNTFNQIKGVIGNPGSLLMNGAALNLGYGALDSALTDSLGSSYSISGANPAQIVNSVNAYITQGPSSLANLGNLTKLASATGITSASTGGTALTAASTTNSAASIFTNAPNANIQATIQNAVPAALKAAGLSQYANVPGIANLVANSIMNLGGLGGMQAYAPSYPTMTLASGSSASINPQAVTYPQAQAYTAAAFYASAPTYTETERSRVQQNRAAYAQASLQATLSLVPTLRSQLSAQPQAIEQVATDAKQATTERADMKANAEAGIAMLQAVTRMQAAATAELDLISSQALQSAPVSPAGTTTSSP